MRRIFGGSSITSSSTSNSLASDALPSPVASTSSSQISRPPLQSSASGSDEPFPTSRSNDTLNSPQDDEPRKGWFGLAGALPRSGSSSSSLRSQERATATTNSAQQTPVPNGSHFATSRIVEEDIDTMVLPFGAAQTPPPTDSSGPTALRSPLGTHSRTTSRSTSWQISGGSPSGSRPFSPSEGEPKPKDSAMLELLSGQAAIEAKEYHMLDWEEMQDAKKEHAQLATRIASLTRSLALETRLRDSAAKLVRLSAPSSPGAPSTISPGGRARVTREQAEKQVAAANAKMDSISTEMYKLGWKEAELRTKLLKHTAGVLGAALRRKEEDEASAAHASFTGSDRALSPFGVHTRSSTAGTDRFEGAHFFAGNKEAVFPHPRSHSPFSSPQLGGSSFNAFGGNGDDSTRVRDLESKVEELEKALKAAREETARQATEHESVRGVNMSETESLRAELDSLRQREAESRGLSSSSKVEAENTRRELDDTRHELEDAHADLAAAKDEVEHLTQEIDTLRHDLSAAQSHAAQVEHDLDEVKSQAANAEEQARNAELDLADHEHRVVEAERRAADLEDELEDVRTQGDLEIGRMRDAGTGDSQSKAEMDRLQDERTRTAQAVGDVLRRHRDHPALGEALRDIPDPGESIPSGELPTYLSDTLDAHFARLADHVESLSHDIASSRDAHDTSRSDFESQLRQATQVHQTEREQLDSTHRELRAQLDDREARLTTTSDLERQLAGASETEAQLRREISAAKMQLSDVESRLNDLSAEQSSTTSKLDGVWRCMPVFDDQSGASDLASLRTAFESRGTGGGTFTVDALVDRIKTLLAEDSNLVRKLVALESEQAGHLDKVDQAAREVDAGQANVKAMEQQVQQLEERMNVSAEREASMLERLNDLTESLEQTRGEKRKLETQLTTMKAQLQTLEAEKTQLSEALASAQAETARLAARPDDSTKLDALNDELQDVKDQLSDVMEELDEAKAREAKTRGQLLEELSGVQSELSSTKSKLRAAERKVAAAAGAR